MSLVFSSTLLFFFGFFNLFGIRPSFAYDHIINFGVGLIVYFLVKKIGRQIFRSNADFFFWLFFVILILTYVIGYEVKGSKRWIDFFLFNFQPSEFFKIFFILYFASFFTQRAKDLINFPVFLQSLVYFMLPTIIIFKQPDLGSSMIFVFIYLVMVIFSKVPKKFFLSLGVIMAIIGVLFFVTLKDYQKMRFTSFFNPQIDQSGTSYNMIQAAITIGSGKFFGKGLGWGTQSRLAFLPENQTDFAFSALIEQFGFLGGFFVIGLYFIIIYLLINLVIKNYYKKTDEGCFDFFYSLGLLSYIFFQFSVNIGMNLGLLPVAGIALPLISHGGSSIVTWMLGLALLP